MNNKNNSGIERHKKLGVTNRQIAQVIIVIFFLAIRSMSVFHGQLDYERVILR